MLFICSGCQAVVLGIDARMSLCACVGVIVFLTPVKLVAYGSHAVRLSS